MKKYSIAVHGCDDSTHITKELTVEQYKLIKEVAQEVTEASTYVCMPVMTVSEEGRYMDLLGGD